MFWSIDVQYGVGPIDFRLGGGSNNVVKPERVKLPLCMDGVDQYGMTRTVGVDGN